MRDGGKKMDTYRGNLDISLTRVQVDMTLEDIRRILRCFKAVEYMMNIDGESYLDEDDYIIVTRLEGIHKILSDVRYGS